MVSKRRSVHMLIFLIAFGTSLLSEVLYCQAGNLEKIKIAYVPFCANHPYFVALEKGFFQKEGLQVESIKVATSSEMMTALISGAVDALAPVSFASIFGVEQRQPGTIAAFLPGGETKGHVISHILVKPDSPIKNMQDLFGKKIGTYSGSSQLMALKVILGGMGMNAERDITIVQVAPELQLPALESGQFDALLTAEPYSTVAMAKKLARVLVENPRSKYIVDPFVSGACAMMSSFVDKKQDLARGVYRAMRAGAEFMQQQPKEAKEILPKYVEITPDVLNATDIYAFFQTDSVIIAASQTLADLSLKYQVLEKKVDAAALFRAEAKLAGSSGR